MTVKALINNLLELPMEAEVCICTMESGEFKYFTPTGCVEYSETEIGILAEPEKAKLKKFLVDDLEILAESKEQAIKKYAEHTNGNVITVSENGFGIILSTFDTYWCPIKEMEV